MKSEREVNQKHLERIRALLPRSTGRLPTAQPLLQREVNYSMNDGMDTHRVVITHVLGKLRPTCANVDLSRMY